MNREQLNEFIADKLDEIRVVYNEYLKQFDVGKIENFEYDKDNLLSLAVFRDHVSLFGIVGKINDISVYSTIYHSKYGDEVKTTQVKALDDLFKKEEEKNEENTEE